jgi:hypothetical protein
VIGLALALGVASEARAVDMKWECRSVGSQETVLWLTGNLDTGLGEVKTLHFTRKEKFGVRGLQLVWVFGDKQFHLALDPDGSATLYEKGVVADVYRCKET